MPMRLALWGYPDLFHVKTALASTNAEMADARGPPGYHHCILLVLFLGLVHADYQTECHQQAGMKRALVHPATTCERYLRIKPDPQIGEACVYGATRASQDASFKMCSAVDWIGEWSVSASRGKGDGGPRILVNSTSVCLGVDSLLQPPYTSVLVEKMRRSCRAGYLGAYRETVEVLLEHLSLAYKDIFDQVQLGPSTVIDWAPEPVVMEGVITEDAPEEVEVEMATDLDLTPYLSVKVHDGQPVRVPIPPDIPLEQAVVSYCKENLKFMGSACARQILRYVKVHGVEATSTTGAAIYPAGIGAP